MSSLMTSRSSANQQSLSTSAALTSIPFAAPSTAFSSTDILTSTHWQFVECCNCREDALITTSNDGTQSLRDDFWLTTNCAHVACSRCLEASSRNRKPNSDEYTCPRCSQPTGDLVPLSTAETQSGICTYFSSTTALLKNLLQQQEATGGLLEQLMLAGNFQTTNLRDLVSYYKGLAKKQSEVLKKTRVELTELRPLKSYVQLLNFQNCIVQKEVQLYFPDSQFEALKRENAALKSQLGSSLYGQGHQYRPPALQQQPQQSQKTFESPAQQLQFVGDSSSYPIRLNHKRTAEEAFQAPTYAATPAPHERPASFQTHANRAYSKFQPGPEASGIARPSAENDRAMPEHIRNLINPKRVEGEEQEQASLRKQIRSFAYEPNTPSNANRLTSGSTFTRRGDQPQSTRLTHRISRPASTPPLPSSRSSLQALNAIHENDYIDESSYRTIAEEAYHHPHPVLGTYLYSHNEPSATSKTVQQLNNQLDSIEYAQTVDEIQRQPTKTRATHHTTSKIRIHQGSEFRSDILGFTRASELATDSENQSGPPPASTFKPFRPPLFKDTHQSSMNSHADLNAHLPTNTKAVLAPSPTAAQLVLGGDYAGSSSTAAAHAATIQRPPSRAYRPSGTPMVKNANIRAGQGIGSRIAAMPSMQRGGGSNMGSSTQQAPAVSGTGRKVVQADKGGSRGFTYQHQPG